MEPRWRRLRGRTGRRSRAVTSPRRGSIRSAGGCSSTDRGSSTLRNTSNSTDLVPRADGGRRGTSDHAPRGMTMAALEEKVIASWTYKKGSLDPKTAYVCYLAADIAVGNTH